MSQVEETKVVSAPNIGSLYQPSARRGKKKKLFNGTDCSQAKKSTKN